MASGILALNSGIRYKTCIRCGMPSDEEAFFRCDGSASAAMAAERYRAVCVGCEVTDRTPKTLEERAKTKAEKCIRTHAEKYGMTPSEFARRYDWNIERMVYDIIHGHENTCTYCWFTYASMGNGLSDITLDIVDPKQEPYYRTNTRWCCGTCNGQKATMSPALWARRLIEWARYRDWRKQLSTDVTYGLPLFDRR